jgi:hypothetical protein
MSNEQIVFDDIVIKTQSNQLSWSIVGNQYASSLIFQPSAVYRIFKTNYFRDQFDSYELLLVEKKFPDPDWDFAIEKYKVELVFIQSGVLVATLDEYAVDFNRLVELARLIESKSTQAKKLFGFP